MRRNFAEKILEETRQNYDRIAQQFSQKRRFAWRELDFLFESFKKGERVLDLGCGNGRFYEVFQKKGVEYYGVDFSEHLIEIAKTLYPEGNFRVANALNLPFKNNFFERVVSIAVFHHIPSRKMREEFLSEVKRVLKPGGKFIFTVWNLWKYKTGRKLLLRYTILRILGISGLDFKDIFYPFRNEKKKILALRYVHCFTKREIEKICQKAGFFIERIGEIGNNIYCISAPIA